MVEMPYNADQAYHFQHLPPNQPYNNQQIQHNQYQYVTGNPDVQFVPLEIQTPTHTNYHQPVNQTQYPIQQPQPQRPHYPLPIVQEQLPAQHGHQSATPSRQAVASQQPTIQVEVPSKAAKRHNSTIENQLVLLHLADEYLRASRGNEMLEALRKGEAQLDDYYKLVSTALGCMETVLKRFRLPPLKEAQLRLHFAKTLYDETENDLEAETALSKGIDLCERNKLPGQKYTMQVLLSKVLYRSSPRAATKAIDGIIEDVVAYKHTCWEYAFRFLRASLSLSMPSHQDFVAAVHQLQKIADLARRKGDQAVFAFAEVTEALAHLQSSSPDSIDQAQRALATARQVQLNQDVNCIPQIQVLLQYVDLCCSLRQSNVEQVEQKLSTMQQMMDQIVDDASWSESGTIYLPLVSKSVPGIALIGDGIVQERNGRHVLTLSWLPKHDVYTIGYLLSGIAKSHKNALGEHKAELFLNEGLALIRNNSDVSKLPLEPLSKLRDQAHWRRMVECQFLAEKAFLLCARSEWDQARAVLDEIDNVSRTIQTRLPPDIHCLARYLAGAVCQGTGDLNTALKIFLSKDLALPPNSHKTSPNSLTRDIALLAAMNTILIIRPPTHPSHHLIPSILSTIDPYLSVSPNKHLLASRSLLISNLPPTTHPLLTNETLSSTLLIKKHLSTALNIAKTIGNAQITALTLSVMSAKFFKGVVGEQAEKSARAGQNMACKSGMKLWMCVSSGMLAETLERQGKREEAGRVGAQALRLAGQIPARVRRFEGVNDDDVGVGRDRLAAAGGGEKRGEVAGMKGADEEEGKGMSLLDLVYIGA